MTELQWIPGERAVVQSSEDKTLRVWDLRSCCVAQQLKPKQQVQVYREKGGHGSVHVQIVTFIVC